MDFVDMVSQAAFQVAHQQGANHTDSIPVYRSVERITGAGKRTLWTVCVIMLLSSFIVQALSLRQHAKTRLFHQITFFITTFSTISYYAMATGAGVAYVLVPVNQKVREVLWARYADWIVTTPLILLNLTLLAGLPGADIILVVIADLGMVLTGIFATLSRHDESRWGFYTFSILFFLYIIYSLTVSSRKSAYLRSDRVGRLFTLLSAANVILWICYFIVLALGEGTGQLSPNDEVLIYGILDILVKPILGFWLLFAQSNMAESNVILPSSWTEPRGGAGGYGSLGSHVPAPHSI